MQEAAFETLHFLTKLICSYLIVGSPFGHFVKYVKSCTFFCGKLFVSYTLNIYFTLPKQKLKYKFCEAAR